MCAITDKLFHFLGKLFRGGSYDEQQTSQKAEEPTAGSSQTVRRSGAAHGDSGRDTGTATRVR